MNIKYILLSICAIAIMSCGTKKHSAADYEKVRPNFESMISAQELESLLSVYASDEFEGRFTGSQGQKKAVEFIKKFYQNNGVGTAPNMNGSYFQKVPMEYINKNREWVKGDSENVLAFIKGSEYPDEVVVVSAHLDHLGMEGEEVFNGADDDGSGTVSVMEIAKTMQAAVKKGYRPKRSILFLHVTGEELGLWGSKYYSENPVIPMSNTITDLNIDMIGRIDEEHQDNERYIYVIGSDMLSDDLDDVLVQVNNNTTNLLLDYKYNDENDPNRFYYRSDHYNFAKNNVPVIFFFNGTHDDYHQISDTPDKINYEMLKQRTQLIFNVLWQIANQDDVIELKNS